MKHDSRPRRAMRRSARIAIVACIAASSIGFSRGIDTVAFAPAMRTAQAPMLGGEGVAIDDRGNACVTDTYAGSVVKIAPNGVESILASGLALPQGITTDDRGNVYATEPESGSIATISPSGSVTVARLYDWIATSL